MMTLRWSPEYSRDAYRDPFALFADAADIMRQEARELAALGCEYIQLDAPELGMLCDPERRRQDFAERGMDPERLLTEGIDIINSVADVAGVDFALHLCRGNNQGYYVGEAATNRSRRMSSLARAISRASCSNTMTGGQGRSSRSAIFRPTRAWCSGSSRASVPSSSPPTRSSSVSMRPAATFRASSSDYRRSAASARCGRATRFPNQPRKRNCGGRRDRASSLARALGAPAMLRVSSL